MIKHRMWQRPRAVLAGVTVAALVLVGCAPAPTGSPTGSNPSAAPLIRTSKALGSGIVLDSSGDVVTISAASGTSS